jgi:membrane protein implicated in regulation of membrane protease activity
MTARRVARITLALGVAAGLGYDAYVHFHLATTYDVIRTSTLSQGDLFRAEGALAVIAAVAVLVRPRRYTAGSAFVVAASALAAVLVYRYVDVGRVGPVPSMYEPAWYPEKTRAAWAEAIAALAAAALLTLQQLERRRAAHRPSEDEQRDGDVLAGRTGADPGVEQLVVAEHARPGVRPAPVVRERSEQVASAAGEHERRRRSAVMHPEQRDGKAAEQP